MRSARRLIASAVLLGAALFLGAGTANADSVWQLKSARVTAAALADDSVWQ
ncbi:hypothetical protein GCM10020229_72680 [Kitasatospora albolonga]